MNAIELSALLAFTFLAGWWACSVRRWFAWRSLRGRRLTSQCRGLRVRLLYRLED